MAKTMEEEIDGLDLTASFSGDGAEPSETETKPEETPAEPPKEEPKEETPSEETKTETTEPEKGKEVKEPAKEPVNPFGNKGHTPKGVQERINDLTRSNREIREQNVRLMRELEELKKGLPQPKEKTRDDFATDEEWIDYRSELKAKAIVERERAAEKERAEFESAEANFAKTEVEARKFIPDYDEVMSKEVSIPADRASFLYAKNSPVGAMILYTLKNVDAVRNQFLMTPESGRIAFLKGVEGRLIQIRQDAEKNKGAEAQQNPPAQQTQQQEPPKTAPALKAPQQVRHPVTGRLNPATCTMDEWMENGD